MKEKPRLYCFTKYTAAGPSSRYRTYQYLSAIGLNFKVDVQAGFGDWYLNPSYNKLFKIVRLLLAFAYRWYKLLTLPSNCMVWLEYELFPYMPPFGEWYLTIRKIPYCVDYDDAIFHNYDQSKYWLIKKLLLNKIPWVMSNAYKVVTGSPYLTQFASQHNDNIIEIPTSVELEQFICNDETLDKTDKPTFVIGWLGSKSTSRNIAFIIDDIKTFANNTNSELWLMGFDNSLAYLLNGVPAKSFEWEAKKEIPFLNTIDVGIMPLYDNPFNHGKCGFKLIQYMAAGKPTISTPMEANLKINRDGSNLFASSGKQWVSAFTYFHGDKKNSIAAGLKNREIVNLYYSKIANEKRVIKVLLEMAKFK